MAVLVEENEREIEDVAREALDHLGMHACMHTRRGALAPGEAKQRNARMACVRPSA
jgi:hypothetical protein